MEGEGPAFPEVYKILLKTAGKDREDLVEYCLENRVLGMGWGPHWDPAEFEGVDLTNFDAYWAAALSVWSRRELSSVAAFQSAPVGSLIWFRTHGSRYHLARLTGDWRPIEDRSISEALDLFNVRAVDLAPVESAAIPGAVVRAFAAPQQQTFCRVAKKTEKENSTTRSYSTFLASELLGGDTPDLHLTTESILDDYLAPLDVEDLIAAYLQDRHDYSLLPSHYSKSSAAYEYVLIGRKNGETAVVQVKTGKALIDTELLDENVADRWFAFSASGQQLPPFVEVIKPEDLRSYMESGAPSLPPVTKRWMALR